MAVDSRADGWDLITTLDGDEIIPVQDAAGSEKRINPDLITTHTSRNPSFYGVAYSATPENGVVLSTGTVVLEYPVLQGNSVGAEYWSAGTFTIPPGKGGVWDFNAFLSLDNVTAAAGPKDFFALKLEIDVNGTVYPGDNALLSRDFLNNTDTMTLAFHIKAVAVAGDAITTQLKTDAGSDMTIDVLAGAFRTEYRGTF